ncbi:MAG: restriction endonuclease subunit S [Cycloclasticus sp.]|nr:restriction endonuclease subunit S [Cycloclasticus sp.]
MSAEWLEVRLEDVTSKLGDGLHGTPKYDDNGEYYFINGNNLGDGKITIDEKTKRATKEEYLKHKKELTDRTILVSINGTIGNIGLYNGEKVFLGKSACYFNVNEEVDKQFIRYVVTSKYFQDHIRSLATGSTIKNVSLKLMRNFTFRLPPLKIQKEISKVLEDLDKKIELNRQTNQTLEHIAQAIFKSWFVDFEPTRAKIAAKQIGQARQDGERSAALESALFADARWPEAVAAAIAEGDPERAAMAAISGKSLDEIDQLDVQGRTNAAGAGSAGAASPEQQTQLLTTAALFPDALVDSELGEIPEGWDVKGIKELSSKISKGTTPRKADIQKAEDAETIPFLKVRDISNDGEITRVGLDKIPESIHSGTLKRSMLEANDLLFSIAGTIGRVALVEEDLSISNCNQAIAFVRLKESEKYLELCRLNLVGSRVQDEVISKVVQGVQANFSLTGLGEIKVLIPSEDLLASFNKTVGDMGNKQRLLLSENRKLAELRDALLPKLLSGELELTSKGAA